MKKDKYFLKINKKDIGKVITAKKDYIVYKSVCGGIAQLLIPKGSKIIVSESYNRSGIYRGKLRTNQAIALLILPTCLYKKTFEDFSFDRIKYSSNYDFRFKYKIGKIVRAKLNTDPSNGCGSGIHFFANFRQAKILHFRY